MRGLEIWISRVLAQISPSAVARASRVGEGGQCITWWTSTEQRTPYKLVLDLMGHLGCSLLNRASHDAVPSYQICRSRLKQFGAILRLLVRSQQGGNAGEYLLFMIILNLKVSITCFRWYSWQSSCKIYACMYIHSSTNTAQKSCINSLWLLLLGCTHFM